MTCRDCDRAMRRHHHPPDGTTVEHSGRGLCERCYRQRRIDGTLHEVERMKRSSAELVEEALWLLDCTCHCHKGERLHFGMACHCGGLRVLADRLGVTRGALYKALQRARVAA